MAENISDTMEEPNSHPGVALTNEQRTTFRSAGFWMAIIGWAEIFFGAVMGLVWVLTTIGAIPGQALGVAPSERILHVGGAIGSVIIGVLTLIAARSFRRAGRDPGAGLPAVTTAVADLAELYERQVWVLFALLAVAIGGALANWW